MSEPEVIYTTATPVAPIAAEPRRRAYTSEDLVTFASILVERSKLAGSLGMQFSGDRDMYKALGYPQSLSFDDYYTRYLRQDIARRIVNSPAQDTWRTQARLLDGDTDNGTPFLDAWQQLVEKRGVWRALAQVDRLAGIGRYGVLLIGFAGAAQLKDPVAPSSMAGPQDVLYLRAFHEGDVTIDAFEQKANNERFGLPLRYKITVSSGQQKEVHWTRVIHVAENAVDDIYGEPRLEAVFNRLNDLEKIIGGGAEATWKLMRKGFALDIKPEYELGQDDEDDMQEQVEEFEHGLRRFMLTRGMTPHDLGSEVVDPSGLFQAIIALIAGATGRPQRILLGSERGELASSQDEANWAAIIEARREQFAEPALLRAFIDRLLWVGALPAPNAGRYAVEWETLFKLTEGEEADIADAYTTALERLINIGFSIEDALAFLVAMPNPAGFTPKQPVTAPGMAAQELRRERSAERQRYWRLGENEKRTAKAVAQEVTAAARLLAGVLDGERDDGHKEEGRRYG